METINGRVPPFAGEGWLNLAEPPTVERLLARGPLLLDFWDYSRLDCLHTLPYLLAWHERYAPLGLSIVGVHSPQFAFAKQREAVAVALERLGIPYPVLLDNAHATASAYAVRQWPAKFLIDGQHTLRFHVMGVGRYQPTEQAIQQLLREQHGPTLALPEPLGPLRPGDAPGVACYRPTPTLHAGYAHGRLGNAGDVALDGVRLFEPSATRDEGRLYFEGAWHGAQQFSESAGDDSRLHVRYRAAELNAVLASADGTAQRLFVLNDGEPLRLGEAGADVIVDSELGSYAVVRAPRLYHLATNPDAAPHELTLEAARPGLRLYALRFVGCPKPHPEPGDLVMP